MDLRFAAGSRDYLRTLAPGPRQAIRQALRLLQEDPRNPRLAAKQLRLEARERLFRVRVGDYRIIYSPRPGTTYIWRIQHRSEGYEWLDRFDPWPERGPAGHNGPEAP
jgi:mRNA-degrading endonuclease RelE of RelBE toxin-antitoxin system